MATITTHAAPNGSAITAPPMDGAPDPAPRPPARTIDNLRVVPWLDPIADPHGVHPCSRYVELYWLGILGPSSTWLLRRLSYGLEINPGGFDLQLSETARSLGLGDRMGKNAPFRRSLQRLATFELARPHGPAGLGVRTRIPPLPLRHLNRLPESLQQSHRAWLAEHRLPEHEQMRRRAARLAVSLAASGHAREEIERRLGEWQFHPAVAFRASEDAVRATVATGGTVEPGDSGDRRK
ncbi:MAG: hypothetical protein ACYCV7_00015 [Acidimicrobiales bacterium]